MPVKWNLDSERELWSAICAPNRWHTREGQTTHPDSLWWFVHIAWGAEWFFRSGKHRWLSPRVHGPYLRWLQSQRLAWQIARKGKKPQRWQVAIIIPRNFGKTLTATKCCSLWTHLDEPDLTTTIGSEDINKAQDFLGAIKSVISGEDPNAWFTWLYGRWDNPDRLWLKQGIVHAARRSLAISEPSYDTASIETGVTGYHPVDNWWDDPLSANKLREGGVWLKAVHTAFDATYFALQTYGWLGLVITRYLDDDVAGRRLREEGVLEWAGMEPPNSTYFEKIPRGKGAWRVYFLQAETTDGIPVLPEVMTAEEITRAKARDPSDFSCQYMNDPGTGEHMPLTEAQLNTMLMDRAKLRWDIPIGCATIHLDTAFKDENTVRSGDDSVIIVFLHDSRPNGLIYFDQALISNEWRSEQFMDELIKVLMDLRRRNVWVKCITDEAEMGGKRQTFRNHLIATIRGAGLNVPAIMQFPRQGTQKVKRIRTAAGFWADGYVRLLCPIDAKGDFILGAVPGLKKLMNQMLRIGVSVHDDAADAAADVWVDKVWIKPTFDTFRNANEVGYTPRTAGDEYLKALGKPLSTDEVKALYDDKYGDPELHGPDESWLPDPLASEFSRNR